jgi:hypothetical protein
MKLARTLAHRAGTIAAISTLALAAACGGGGGDKAGDAFVKKSGQDIADASKADMKTLDEVHYSGEIKSGTSDINIDIQAKSNGDCTGTVGIAGGKATVLSAGGKSYFKGDDAFWKGTVGDSADQVIAAVGDKWVLDSDNNFSQFCDLDKFFDSLFSTTGDSGTSTYKTGSTSTLAGQKVVKVERVNATDGNSTGYVLVDGKHYLVKIERTSGSDAGSLTFADFDKDFSVTAPASDDVVDPSTLG